jgi:single-strand DNA-binding protein
MTDTTVTITGNLTENPELRFTQGCVAVANFRVAVTPRRPDGKGGWTDGETSFFKIVAWRQLAENLAGSLGKGDRVIVTGQLRMNSWETPEGEKRSIVEVQADEVGPSLRWATAKPEKASRTGEQRSSRGGDFNDPPPTY